jgi:parallel beta-helix repeat protein
MLMASLLSASLNIRKAKASGIIYTREDGSIDPPTANITTANNVTYTFTDDIYDSIVVERDGITIDGAGYMLRGTAAHDSRGIDLSWRANVTVQNAIIAAFSDGVLLLNSSDCSIDNSTIANNTDGIWLEGSPNTSVSGNTIIANHGFGIYLEESPNTSVSSNNVTNNQYGIFLWFSSNISFSGNTIAGNNVDGMQLGISSGNRLYHNNFIDNGQQVRVYPSESANVWDGGYPLGGNYWSNYTDADSYKGPNQNETGSDGVWDHPCVIDADNQDRYPLTRPFGWFPAGDVDGDRDVDIFDIVRMAGVYGAKYPDPRYDRLCDVDLDGDVDIFDIVIAAGHYGDSW